LKRKVTRKLGLSKETLRTLDAENLDHVAGGILTDGTNPCSVCPICASAFPTCILNTEGICC
jgi:hypothetical protein